MVTILGSKLLLIDIKQAQIRVQFDRIWSKLKEASVASQQLLFPVQLNITPSEAFLIEEYAGQFAVAGFDWNVSQDKKSMEITKRLLLSFWHLKRLKKHWNDLWKN